MLLSEGYDLERIAFEFMVTDVSPEQYSNAELSMLVRPSPIATDVRPEQLEKVRSPMLVTLLGILIDVRPEQPRKA